MRRLRNWRRGRLGKFLGVHSPSAHARGTCWCKGTRHEIFPEQITASQVLSDIEGFYRFISTLPCRDRSCNNPNKHNHGFACDVTCVVCKDLTRSQDGQ